MTLGGVTTVEAVEMPFLSSEVYPRRQVEHALMDDVRSSDVHQMPCSLDKHSRRHASH